MMCKRAFAIFFVFSLVSSVAQALTVTYPTKSALKKADHITSLVMTGAVVSSWVLAKNKYGLLSGLSLMSFFTAVGANVVINGMALKYDKSPTALLKLLLPTAMMCESLGIVAKIKKSALQKALHATIGVNMFKNIWDMYSLIKYDQSEDIQYDA